MACLVVASVSVLIISYSDTTEFTPMTKPFIVLPISRDLLDLTYLDELNKYVQDEDSLLYVSRVTGDHLYIVLAKPEQAAKLVNEVRKIKINDTANPIKFLVADLVKIIISKAGYCVTNFALKDCLTRDCQIKATSSVSDLKANIDSSNQRFTKTKSFRREINLHQKAYLKELFLALFYT